MILNPVEDPIYFRRNIEIASDVYIKSNERSISKKNTLGIGRAAISSSGVFFIEIESGSGGHKN